MTNMERRLVKHGPSSTIVALPAAWVKERGLKAGDSIKIQLDGDRLLLAASSFSAPEEIELAVDGLDRTSIMLLIRSAYRQGYSRIIIRYSGAHAKHHRVQRDIPIVAIVHQEVMRLVGVEIIEQGEGKLVIQEITKPVASELPVLYRKVFQMVRQLIAQIGSEQADADIGVEDRHDVITKVISHAIRLINSGYAELPVTDRTRMYHTLSLIDIIVDILKYYSRENAEYERVYLQELEKLVLSVEQIVFAHSYKAMNTFQLTKEQMRVHSVPRLSAIVDICFDIVLTHAST